MYSDANRDGLIQLSRYSHGVARVPPPLQLTPLPCTPSQSVSPSPCRRDSGRPCSEGGPDGACGGQAALVAMGVKTGLTLVFSLLRQSWAQQTGAGKRDAEGTDGAPPPIPTLCID